MMLKSAKILRKWSLEETCLLILTLSVQRATKDVEIYLMCESKMQIQFTILRWGKKNKQKKTKTFQISDNLCEICN